MSPVLTVLAALLQVGSSLAGFAVHSHTGEQVDLATRRGVYQLIVLWRAQLSPEGERLATRLARLDSSGMPFSVAVVSRDEVSSLRTLVSGHAAPPVLYSVGGPDPWAESVPGARAALLVNQAGRVVREWREFSAEALPDGVAAWFASDGLRSGEEAPLALLPSAVPRDKPLLVLFLSTRSGVVDLYADRIVELSQAAEARGVTTVGLFSEADETDEFIREYASRARFSFPCFRDDGGVLADLFRARVAPTAFLVSAEGKVVYGGAIDSSTYGDEETRPYLRSAIEALAVGVAPSVAYARPFGTRLVLYRAATN